MCCGQKRAVLTTQPSPTPREIPNFRRNASAEARSRAASVPAASRRAPQASPPAPPFARATAPPDSPGLKDTSACLQYRDQSPIRVRGLATGRVYQFSGQQQVQAVDERDAAALLQTRLFQ